MELWRARAKDGLLPIWTKLVGMTDAHLQELILYMAFPDIAPTGASGDPTQASPEKGRIMFERMVNLVAGFVAQFRRVAM